MIVMLIHKGCGGEVKEDRSLTPYHYSSNEDENEIEIYPHICQKCYREIGGDAELDLEGRDQSMAVIHKRNYGKEDPLADNPNARPMPV